MLYFKYKREKKIRTITASAYNSLLTIAYNRNTYNIHIGNYQKCNENKKKRCFNNVESVN